MVDFKENQLYIFATLFKKGQLLKDKNLLLEEQILSFRSKPFLIEAIRFIQKFAPLSEWWKGQIYTILE